MPPVFQIKFHKSNGQAFVLHQRKRIYLGAWSNHPASPPESVVARFRQVVAQIALGEVPGAPNRKSGGKDGRGELLLSELAADWLAWAADRYANPETARNLAYSLKPLLDLFGPEPAGAVGPKRIAEAQKAMAQVHGWTRQGILKATARVRQMFAWGVAQELIDPMHLVKVKAMQPLRHGAIEAPESPGIDAVPVEDVAATIPHLGETVRMMVRVQLLTGMRPAEVCAMTVADIDRSNPRRWVYRPSDHKMAHLKRVRAIPLVPEVIAILVPLLRADGKPIFSPADEIERWQKEKRARRKSKVQPSQVDRSKADPERCPGDQYDTRAYRKAITRACRRAKVQPWSPNRLRKLAAQQICDAFGIDSARALLGHADSSITKLHYAKLELEAASKAAEALGKTLGAI
jgi:integrase